MVCAPSWKLMLRSTSKPGAIALKAFSFMSFSPFYLSLHGSLVPHAKISPKALRDTLRATVETPYDGNATSAADELWHNQALAVCAKRFLSCTLLIFSYHYTIRYSFAMRLSLRAICRGLSLHHNAFGNAEYRHGRGRAPGGSVFSRIPPYLFSTPTSVATRHLSTSAMHTRPKRPTQKGIVQRQTSNLPTSRHLARACILAVFVAYTYGAARWKGAW